MRKKNFKHLFEQWRGEDAKKEASYLDTALLFVDYAATVANPEAIEADFCDSQSPKYRELDKYKARSFGTALFCKLATHDYLLSLAHDDGQRLLVQGIHDIIETLYLNPKSNTEKNIFNLIDAVNQWLDVCVASCADKQRARQLCLSLFIILNIARLMTANLNRLMKVLVSGFVNLSEIEANLTLLLEKSKDVANHLCEAIIPEEAASGSSLDIPHVHVGDTCFYEKYLPIVDREKPLLLIIPALQRFLHRDNRLLQDLQKARTEQAVVLRSTKKIQYFLDAIRNNEQKITGRQYVLEFLEEHQANFQILLQNCSAEQNRNLQDKINQVEESSYSKAFLYLMSWSGALVTVPFRYAAPSGLQAELLAYAPATLDGECKQEIKCLTQICLGDLQQKLALIENEQDRVITLLTKNNSVWEAMVRNATHQQLDALRRGNEEILEVLSFLREVLQVKSSGPALEVRSFFEDVSSFTARFSRLFSSEHDTMMAEARRLKSRFEDIRSDVQSPSSLDFGKGFFAKKRAVGAIREEGRPESSAGKKSSWLSFSRLKWFKGKSSGNKSITVEKPPGTSLI
ncbi:hypothetical protein [Legionella spiritensis]|uniref:hypothetical protein n=1 Tax=Legionella spiritensis TaxID=452 RepID=UPI000730C771|nr:hypothetical protein [Legionella spiritensis]